MNGTFAGDPVSSSLLQRNDSDSVQRRILEATLFQLFGLQIVMLVRRPLRCTASYFLGEGGVVTPTGTLAAFQRSLVARLESVDGSSLLTEICSDKAHVFWTLQRSAS